MSTAKRGELSHVILIGATQPDAMEWALRTTVALDECSAKVLAPGHESEMIYEPSDLRTGELLDHFMSGNFRSVHFECESPTRISALLFSPNFGNNGQPWWTLLLELRDRNASFLAEQLRTLPHMLFLALYVEDYLVEMPVPLTSDTFPWGSPWLVTATVVDPDGSVTTRPGEASRRCADTNP